MKEVHRVHLLSTAAKLVKYLSDSGVGCYVYHKASTGSVYVRFDNPTIGSVRFSDHSGRSHLKYKYNILLGEVRSGWKKEENHWRYYAPVHDWKKVAEVIIKSTKYIKDNDINYGRVYFKPSFKK